MGADGEQTSGFIVLSPSVLSPLPLIFSSRKAITAVEKTRVLLALAYRLDRLNDANPDGRDQLASFGRSAPTRPRLPRNAHPLVRGPTTVQ